MHRVHGALLSAQKCVLCVCVFYWKLNSCYNLYRIYRHLDWLEPTMRLSKKGEYALRAMIALARNEESAMTITQIATSQTLPKKFLEQILLALKSSGLVRSKAGPKGGYELAEPARSITVGMILGAVEEPISHTRTANNTDENLAPSGVLTLLEDIKLYVRNKLETVSLQEIADEAVTAQDMEALMWYI